MMNPVAYKVVVNGNDITAVIADRVEAITVTDNTGKDSDTVAITLDDRDQKIALPEHGVDLTVYLGEKVVGQENLMWAGVYTVDEVETDDRDGTLVIHGKAADMMGSLKTLRDESYDDVTLQHLLSTIAKRHGYKPVISVKLANQFYEHIDQRGQSDIDLLSTKAEEIGALCKPTGKRLCILLEDEGKTASGKTLAAPPIDAKAKGVFIYGRIIGPNKYNSVKAYWQHPEGSKKDSVSVGGIEELYIMSEIFDTHERAVVAAKAKLAQLKRGEIELTCDITLNLSYGAERTVKLFNHRHAGTYIIKSAQHVIGKAVGTTKLTLRLPTAKY